MEYYSVDTSNQKDTPDHIKYVKCPYLYISCTKQRHVTRSLADNDHVIRKRPAARTCYTHFQSLNLSLMYTILVSLS